jgi:hypothetical protein
VAEQPVRAGGRVWPQPVADVGGQPDPAVIPARQRQRGQRPAQPRDADLAGVDRVIDRAVTAAALRLQRQLRQHVYPVWLAQHRVRQLEQRIPAPAQAPVHLIAERRQQLARQGLPVLARITLQRHTESHGHRATARFLRQELTVARWPPAVTTTRRTTPAKPLIRNPKG